MIISVEDRTFSVEFDRQGPVRIREERTDHVTPACRAVYIVTRWSRGEVSTDAAILCILKGFTS